MGKFSPYFALSKILKDILIAWFSHLNPVFISYDYFLHC